MDNKSYNYNNIFKNLKTKLLNNRKLGKKNMKI